jgi:tetratricopeptide (TPR) repeat protein
VNERGHITKDLTFLDENVRSEIEAVLKVTDNYWDFAELLSKKAVQPDCPPNLVYISLYHLSRLKNNKAIARIIDAHLELPIPEPFTYPQGTDYTIDKDLIEKSIELNQNDVITFYMLMRLYRATAIGSPEEEQAKNRIEKFLAQNTQMRLHAADYYGHTGWRIYEPGPDIHLEYYNRALELARESGDKWHQASLLTLIAEESAQFKTGKDTYSAAKKYLSAAMDLCREINDKGGIATALQNMAVFAFSRFEIGEAFDCQLESALIQGELGEVSPNAASNMAGIYGMMGDQKSALEWTKNLKEEELGPYALFPMISHHLSQKNIKEAEKCLDKARELTLALGHEKALASLYQTTASVDRAKGDLESALDNEEKALEIYDRASRQLRIRGSLLQLSAIELEMFMPTKQNRMDKHAGKYMERLEQEVENNDIPGVKARLMLLKSELRMKQGRHDEGEELLDQVINFTDSKTMRFIHKKAVEKKEEWTEEGIIPVIAPRQPRDT